VPVPPGPALAESMTPEMLRAAQDAERKNRFEEYSESESEEEKVRSPKLLSPTLELCQGETLLSLKERWDQLVEDMFVAEKQAFLHTKIPDVYDNIKYDAEHNSDVLERIRPLYRCAKRVADFVVPQEYGVTRNEKLTIGRIVVQPLLNRMVRNLETGLEDQPASRAFFYFSSESHLHCLRNVLLLSGIPENETVANILESLELHYMSHCVFRLYEDLSRAAEDPLRFYVNVQFSPGAALDPFTHLQNGHMTPVSRPVPVVGRMSFAAFKALLANS
jgi:inositol hexakisphosphate/diphosphoinositol-pentakisphosphate kinase